MVNCADVGAGQRDIARHVQTVVALVHIQIAHGKAKAVHHVDVVLVASHPDVLEGAADNARCVQTLARANGGDDQPGNDGEVDLLDDAKAARPSRHVGVVTASGCGGVVVHHASSADAGTVVPDERQLATITAQNAQFGPSDCEVASDLICASWQVDHTAVGGRLYGVNTRLYGGSIVGHTVTDCPVVFHAHSLAQLGLHGAGDSARPCGYEPDQGRAARGRECSQGHRAAHIVSRPHLYAIRVLQHHVVVGRAHPDRSLATRV